VPIERGQAHLPNLETSRLASYIYLESLPRRTARLIFDQLEVGKAGMPPPVRRRQSFKSHLSAPQLQPPAFSYIIASWPASALVEMEENRILLRLTFVRTIRRNGWSSAL
jgi:hypothetical protein